MQVIAILTGDPHCQGRFGTEFYKERGVGFEAQALPTLNRAFRGMIFINILKRP